MTNAYLDRFLEQLRRSSNRYEDHSEQRAARMSQVQQIERGNLSEVNPTEIDNPLRVARRVAALAVKPDSRETFLDAADAHERPAPETFLMERIINKNELMSADFLIRGAMKCRSTGRIVIRSASGDPLGYGTGFMISSRLLMTNNHVLAQPGEAAQSTVQFDYVESPGRTSIEVSEYGLDPDSFFETSVELDYTVVALRTPNQQGESMHSRGWSPLIALSGKMIVGERVNIIQHPGGETQQIAIRQNQIVDLVDSFLHYSSDTRRGSSGSPVANDQWQVGALHHAGVPRKQNGRIMLVDGRPWDMSPDTVHLIDYVANEGTRVSRIVEDLQMQVQSPEQRRLLHAAFESPDSEQAPTLPGARQDRYGSPASRSEPVVRDGRAYFTVPLELSVGLPGWTSSSARRVDNPDAAPELPTRTQPKLSGTDARQRKSSLQDQLQQSLRALHARESEVYYDAEADERAIETYYQGIAENDELVDEPLFHELATRLKRTHSRRLSYREARLDHLYPNVDLHPDGKLRSIYSGKAFEAEEIIRIEIERELALERRLQERLDTSQLSAQEYEQQLELLESELLFNCEHVVCQSWFNRRQPMKADLHHLFACEPGCNSFRSNIPYFQFSPDEEAVRQDCGRREDGGSGPDKFEPTTGKGPVARATLYFLMRYPGQIGDEARELQRDRLGILLAWHLAEPVSDYERHRNAEIFEIQGNRNPLIDYPDWAEFISFELGFDPV